MELSIFEEGGRAKNRAAAFSPGGKGNILQLREKGFRLTDIRFSTAVALCRVMERAEYHIERAVKHMKDPAYSKLPVLMRQASHSEEGRMHGYP